jgi:hypothetical protein
VLSHTRPFRPSELTGEASPELLGSGPRRCAPPPEGTQLDPVDANGVPAEWVVTAGVAGERGGAVLPQRLPLWLARAAPGLLPLLSAASQARVLSASYRLTGEHRG